MGLNFFSHINPLLKIKIVFIIMRQLKLMIKDLEKIVIFDVKKRIMLNFDQKTNYNVIKLQE